jgi:hypothetical protein
MARMSIDDKVRRDQRLYDLAELLAWSQRETLGAMFDVWEMCHDRVDDVLPEAMINNRVFRDAPKGTPVDFDFVGKMITVGYAKRHRSPRMITVIDATEMIHYLKRSKTSGRKGGIKSGESRRKHTKGRFADPQGSLNLPDLVPDLVPDLASPPDRSIAPDPDPDLEPSSWLTPSDRSPNLPEMASPGAEKPEKPKPTLRVVGPVDELVRELGAMHANAFARVKATLQSTAMGPLATDTHDQLRTLLESFPSTEGARERCMHAITVQEHDAARKKTLTNFGPGMWKLSTFEKSLTFELPKRRDPAPPRPSAIVNAAVDDSGQRPPGPRSSTEDEPVRSLAQFLATAPPGIENLHETLGIKK